MFVWLMLTEIVSFLNEFTLLMMILQLFDVVLEPFKRAS